jgi:putative transposase
VRYTIDTHGLSERRACKLVGLPRSVWQYQFRKDDSALNERMKELATEWPRFGYRRLHVLLKREGLAVNRKRVYRLYRLGQLALRKRLRKRGVTAPRIPRSSPLYANERWSMDFMADQLESGKRFRTLNIVDDRTRECLALSPAFSLTAENVVAILDAVIAERGKPRTIVTDNGPEFVSLRLEGWAYRNGVALQRIRPGKPVENAYIESFNGRVRDECLNQHVFAHLDEATRILAHWRRLYNEVRPHSALGNLSPNEFAAQIKRAALPPNVQGETLQPAR